MGDRRTVLHIIDSLGRGGAETLLVGAVKSTPALNHIIVSLKPVNEFSSELAGIKVYFLNFKWYHSIPQVVNQVKQIILAHQIQIIHAHLFWSVIISRLACPANIKLFNSYHALLYGKSGGANYPFYARLLDKLTYHERIITLCVSSQVKKNIQEFIGIKNNVYVLYNFIDDAFYENFRPMPTLGKKIRMVAVGNLKKDKNYEVIINALSLLDAAYTDKVQLDIYGSGPLLDELQLKCKQKCVKNIQFKGAVMNVAAVLPGYDVYIISSTSEGFGLAVVEAMAVGLPVIVSDIPTLREVTGGNAIYFNPMSATDLLDKVKQVLIGKADLQIIAKKGQEYSRIYSKEVYLSRLVNLYTD